jgi:hypothetical protein
VPQDAILEFSIRTAAPQSFSRSTQLEVASVEGAFSVMLTTDNGTLLLADAHVAREAGPRQGVWSFCL